jgi:uncharacterized protein
LALVYFDASALVKLVVEEEGSELAASLWDGCDSALSARLACPEVCAALAVAGRNHDLSPRQLTSVQAGWEELWAAMRAVELSAAVERDAGELAHRHGLRGADAVHLASARALAETELIVAVWDRRLHAGALAERLIVAPRTLK